MTSAARARARARLRRCEEELDRYEPAGPDYRGIQAKLIADVRRAENDVMLLANVLRAAEHAQEAFEGRDDAGRP